TEVRDLERTREQAGAPATNAGYRLSNNPNEDEVHLRDYWRAVYKHLWLVLGITVLVTMLAAVYMARKPDIYEAGSRVQVDLENSAGLSTQSKNNSFIVNNQTDPAYFNTQLQILTGPGLLRRVVKTLDLEHDQSFIRPQGRTVSTWQSLLRMFGLSKKTATEQQVAASNEVPLSDALAPASSSDDLSEARQLAPFVNALQTGLKVDPVKETRAGGVKETRLIDIRFTHSDPQVAAKIVNAVATVFVHSNLEKKNETNSSQSKFLTERIAELQSQIRDGSERLQNYAKSQEILSLDSNQNTVVERLAGLNRELLEAEKDRTDAEAAYFAAQRPGAAEAKAVDGAKVIAEYESKLAELRAKRDQLLQENTEEWFEVKEVNQQIAIFEKQLTDTRNEATKVVKTNIDTKYREAKAREDTLRAAYNKQRAETMAQNEAAITYRIIQQEVETYKELLNGLLQKSKENDVLLAGTPNNINVVDYAISPDEPVGPGRMRVVVLALVLSLGFGMAFAIFLEYLNDTVRSTEDVEKMLRLPTLAVIPAIGDLKGPGRRLLPGGGGKKDANWRNSNELLLDADARSPLAEAYRHLRTSVLLSTAGRPPKTLLITSSVPSEGKTTTAVNTAISLAQTGAKVLVIDADMRRPRLHSLFDVEKRLGLSSILSNEMSEAEIFSMIEQHEQSGLYLLTAGPIPPNPAELIGSEQMRALIGKLEPTFNHIIIDSPPIASFTDGVLIASIVDGVLLVVHGGKSTRDVVRRSQQLLHDVGAKIFGVVLNNVHLRPHDYYYYQSYYQQSYYNRDPEEGLAGTQG
ncbi:MAG: polysaccharide biosynthesis transport protein, partial [Blastocatellia bacterium]|nr:polysaccharide biosynthesis transport protein [Blastocatellia bacterium]